MDKETELTRKRYNQTSHICDMMDRMIKPELRANAKAKVREAIVPIQHLEMDA